MVLSKATGCKVMFAPGDRFLGCWPAMYLVDCCRLRRVAGAKAHANTDKERQAGGPQGKEEAEEEGQEQ